MGETLSSKTSILLSSNLCRMVCKSAGLVNKWFLDQILLCYCTKTELTPPIFYVLECLKHLRFWTMNTQNCFTLQVIQCFFLPVQKSFPSVLSKEVSPGSFRMHNKSTQRKAAKHGQTSHGKLSERGSTIVSKTYNLEAKKKPCGVRKRLTAQ